MDTITLDTEGVFSPITWAGGTGVLIIEGTYGGGSVIPTYELPTGSSTKTRKIPFIDSTQQPYVAETGPLGFLFELPENALIACEVRNAPGTVNAQLHLYGMEAGAPPYTPPMA